MWGHSSVGRTSGLQPEGPGFESPWLHQLGGYSITAIMRPCQGLDSSSILDIRSIYRIDMELNTLDPRWDNQLINHDHDKFNWRQYFIDAVQEKYPQVKELEKLHEVMSPNEINDKMTFLGLVLIMRKYIGNTNSYITPRHFYLASAVYESQDLETNKLASIKNLYKKYCSGIAHPKVTKFI